MSENAQRVLDAIRAFERKDWATALEIWHEDGWITGPPDWPEAEPFRGREAVIGQFRRLTADFEEQEFANVEIVRDDPPWLVATFTWIVRGAASGAAVEAPMAAAFRLEAGLFTEAHFRRTLDEALAAPAAP